MRLVLLSGGSGKRLWPLSNDSRSKQFLKVLVAPDGRRESMLERVWRQIRSAGLADRTLIATSKSQVDMIYSQLGSNVPLVVEPERRDTFPAVALSISYLHSVVKCDPSETIIVLPVDPFVDNDFFTKLLELDKVVCRSSADVALMGVSPTYPSEKYGYIVPEGLDTEGYYRVSFFREKPSVSQAEELLQLNALWNCGVFAFQLKFMINLLKEKQVPISYKQLALNYRSLTQISFDYEVVEQARNIVALSYNGSWKDIGTWNTLTEEMTGRVFGKGLLSHDSTNTNIVNELDVPVAVLGVSNIVVAASLDGILVTDKRESSRMKELLSDHNQQPMYEEKRWGWHKVLDFKSFGEEHEVMTKRVCIYAKQNISYQVHFKRSETWSVVSGQGSCVKGGELFTVRPGDVVQFAAGTNYAFRAETELECVVVKIGQAILNGDDTELCKEWDETLKLVQNHKIVI
ncbi:sugar phosphate nucleotidyltransferase [Paenibacillus albus]|uniref:Cupin domain-containing protein n=1 Tax=Paenibacillus albus TaxID=2495582 RepID=A0A3S8ZYD4_9BACL|nr:sugar phosphate nucleotidyltransferase [Paenibacillus albus]AZN38501.1 cupin domain-containing protein [Paenibacillus albus]